MLKAKSIKLNAALYFMLSALHIYALHLTPFVLYLFGALIFQFLHHNRLYNQNDATGSQMAILFYS